jgi:hypothetical protein
VTPEGLTPVAGYPDNQTVALTDAERARNYRDRQRGGPPPGLAEHGTVAAHKRHRRRKHITAAVNGRTLATEIVVADRYTDATDAAVALITELCGPNAKHPASPAARAAAVTKLDDWTAIGARRVAVALDNGGTLDVTVESESPCDACDAAYRLRQQSYHVERSGS